MSYMFTSGSRKRIPGSDFAPVFQVCLRYSFHVKTKHKREQEVLVAGAGDDLEFSHSSGWENLCRKVYRDIKHVILRGVY